jgi:hypothetical protein
MLAALATIAFLAAIWLFVVAAATTLEESGSKIVAALRGKSPLATPAPIAPVAVRVRLRSRPQPVLRARPQLRAAA